MIRTSTLALTLLLTGVAQAQLSPTTMAPLAAHLLEVNAQWKAQDPMSIDGDAHMAFNTEAERIATHLRMVRERLMARMPEGLSARQQAERTQLLDRLANYANDGSFPQNHVLPYRNPVFIDPHGTACAVGWLMIESGHRDLAEEISEAMNLAYVLDMPGTPQWPAIAAWADEHGFGTEELAWIQPGYPPNVPWAPFGGGTDGPVTVLYTMANGNVLVGGSFSEAGGQPARNVALWNGATLVPLANGLEGEVNCAVEFNGALYVGGSMLSGIADLARWNGAAWEFSVVMDGKLPRIHALHVHGGLLHAAGETAGFAGIDHRVMRLDGGTWQGVGQPLNEMIHALESFDGALVAGGAFTHTQWITDPPIRHVARFDGTAWQQLGDGLDATVRDLLTSGGALYAGGNLFANIIPTFGLARLQPGSNNWEAMLPGHANYMGGGFGPSYIASMAERNGVIYLGGRFDLSDILTNGNHVASFNGQLDGVEPLAYLDQQANAITTTGNRLVIGGEFNTILPHVAITELSTGIDGTRGTQALSLAPVPATDELFILMPQGTSSRMLVQLLDGRGRRLSVPLWIEGDRIRLDVRSLVPGIYVVEALGPEGLSRQRFVKV
jgi:hypothetical protein